MNFVDIISTIFCALFLIWALYSAIKHVVGQTKSINEDSGCSSQGGCGGGCGGCSASNGCGSSGCGCSPTDKDAKNGLDKYDDIKLP